MVSQVDIAMNRLIRMTVQAVVFLLFLGCLCLSSRVPGADYDLNHDGAVNVLDLQILVNTILAGTADAAKDLNLDGRINVLDLQLLVNSILGVPVAQPGAPQIAGCQIFPADNPWNRDISGDSIDSNSANYIAHMNGGSKFLHPDFGSNPSYGIPFVVVSGTQPKVPMTFDYADESDPGPYPIPQDAPVEGGSASTGDRHILVLDKDHSLLYETYDSHYVGPGWRCGSGAVFDLRSNQLRPDYWTSADAAGLPILPGLVRYDEVAAGAVNHAIRFTVQSTQRAFIHPATHFASSNTDSAAPPMGLRVRLKANYDISRTTGSARVIATALKKYGLILADNGSDWFFTGATDPRWNDNELNQLKAIPGSAFEVVTSGSIIR
jgi:hypothetical protein